MPAPDGVTADLQLIWAQATNGVIGRGEKIPLHPPEDLLYFKAVTNGHPVIMGRKTWDSLPVSVRPLPGRRNIVITRQERWAADGVAVAHSLAAALDIAGGTEGPVFVIGGGELYREAMPHAAVLHVTEVGTSPTGDAFAPAVDDAWSSEGDMKWLSSEGGIRYRMVRYRRRSS